MSSLGFLIRKYNPHQWFYCRNYKLEFFHHPSSSGPRPVSRGGLGGGWRPRPWRSSGVDRLAETGPVSESPVDICYDLIIIVSGDHPTMRLEVTGLGVEGGCLHHVHEVEYSGRVLLLSHDDFPLSGGHEVSHEPVAVQVHIDLCAFTF